MSASPKIQSHFSVTGQIAGASATTAEITLLPELTSSTDVFGLIQSLIVKTVGVGSPTTASYIATLKVDGTVVETFASRNIDLTTQIITDGKPTQIFNCVGQGPVTLLITADAAAGTSKSVDITVTGTFEKTQRFPFTTEPNPFPASTQVRIADLQTANRTIKP